MASSRERLIEAAQELFLSQGISHTTTRQIANLAEVNEVTLFRNFGNKHGLLQAVIKEAPPFQPLGEVPAGNQDTLRQYAGHLLQTMEQAPAFLRSLIGEADQYPPENRQALGQRLDEASQVVAQELMQALPASVFPPGQLAGLLAAALLGYVVIEATSDGHHLWGGREEFLSALVNLLGGAELAATTEVEAAPETVQDLPEPWVHQMLQRAKSAGAQDYAIAYVLFGAGLAPAEVVRLVRTHHLSDKTQHTLQVGDRQVPVNQWILGKRYGSFVSNPLTKWLKSRKDDRPLLFLKDGAPLTSADIQQMWRGWAGELQAQPLQAKQTWCVEMLTRGMEAENLSILSGWSPEELEPYVLRSQAKAALEQARQLDQK